jgi:hypothetical protein
MFLCLKYFPGKFCNTAAYRYIHNENSPSSLPYVGLYCARGDNAGKLHKMKTIPLQRVEEMNPKKREGTEKRKI